MSRLGILNSGSLLGTELKGALERRRDLWSRIDLLELETEDYATVSEVAGEAVVVKSADDDNLAVLDLLFVCPGALPPAGELAERLGAAGTVIVLSPCGDVPGAIPVVDGLNLERAEPGGLLVSPDAGAIALGHLLHPLRPLGLEEATAWIVQPASAQDQEGVDELLEQTRRVLAFETEIPDGVLGRRLANNLYPAGSPASLALAGNVIETLGGDLRLGVETVHAGVFHAVAASVCARLAPETEVETVRQALGDHPYVRMSPDSEPPGPVEAAGGEALLVGEIRPDLRRPGAFWLWGAADNLTFGGAANALAIAEALLLRPN